MAGPLASVFMTPAEQAARQRAMEVERQRRIAAAQAPGPVDRIFSAIGNAVTPAPMTQQQIIQGRNQGSPVWGAPGFEDETQLGYLARQTATIPQRTLESAGSWIGNTAKDLWGGAKTLGSQLMETKPEYDARNARDRAAVKPAGPKPANFYAPSAAPNAPTANGASMMTGSGGRFTAPAEYQGTVQAAASKYNIDPKLLSSLIYQESRWNPGAVSPAGARGIAQFMPGTAKEQGVNVANPGSSIYGAAKYLRQLIDAHGGDVAKGVASYNGGIGNVNKAIAQGGANWLSLLRPETQAYVPQVLGQQAGGVGDLLNPQLRTGYGDAAIGALMQGLQASSQPQQFQTPDMPMPTLAKPEVAAPTDFSKSDEALEMMRPEEFALADQQKMIRQGLFAGMAQALMATPDGAGLGKVLGMLGAGMLGGKMQGQADVQKRQDMFDAKLAQWQSANFRNESDKAQVRAREAQQVTNDINQWTRDDYNARMKKWDYDMSHAIQFTNNGVVTRQVDPKTGMATWTMTPDVGALTGRMMEGVANIYGSMQGQDAALGRAAYANQIAVTSQAVAQSQMSDPEKAATIAGLHANQAVDFGQGDSVIGDPAISEQLNKEINTAAAQMGLTPGSEEYLALRRRMYAATISKMAIRGVGGVNDRLLQSNVDLGPLSRAESLENKRTTTKTTPGKAPSVSEVVEGF